MSAVDRRASELDTIAARLASANPTAYKNLRPRVTPYAKPILEGGDAPFVKRLLTLVNGIFVLLLAIVCVNVATLVFARSATRGWEITVRTALGATRGRIVVQLCLEALVLAGVAAVVGLTLAKVALRWTLDVIGPRSLPFWIDDSLSWTTVLYALLLTVFGAAIVGTDGMTAAGGVTTHDETEARTNNAMVTHAQRVIVVADGSKIAKLALAQVATIDQVDVLVTDTSADPAVLDGIRAAGVEVRVVDAVG